MTDGEAFALLALVLLALRRSATVQLAEGWVWPVPSWNALLPQISQGFDDPAESALLTARSRRHLGVDILYRVGGRWTAPADTPIVAANAGTVERVTRSPRGWSVVVDHGPVLTFYQHLQSTVVARGQRVAAGERLGTMGEDPLDAQHVRHLHFELWQRVGAAVAQIDPQPLMAPWRVIPWIQ